MSEDRKKVFISYSWENKAAAEQVRDAIPEQFDIWIDSKDIAVGDRLSEKLQEGLKGADYYVLIISKGSNTSPWVKNELAYSFDLANRKKLSLVPFLLEDVEVPFEFRGLFYIDARKSFQDGLKRLREFFVQQYSRIYELEPRQLMLKSLDDEVQRRLACNELLRSMSLGELRFLISQRLTIEQVEVVWFDLFNRRMSDEVQVRNVALCSVELIDRSRREELLLELMDTLCRNHPRLVRR